jgi:hypothetical protein
MNCDYAASKGDTLVCSPIERQASTNSRGFALQSIYKHQQKNTNYSGAALNDECDP